MTNSGPAFDDLVDHDVAALIARRPHSALAVELPQHLPARDRTGRSVPPLQRAATALAAARAAGAYRPVPQVVVLYRITTTTGARTHAMFCLIDTDQVSCRLGEPGRVIRNEQVNDHTVDQIAALTHATGHSLSPVLLIHEPIVTAVGRTRPRTSAPTGRPRAPSSALHAALVRHCLDAGDPALTESDHHGARHELWPMGPGPQQRALCRLASDGRLVVADGNHRTLAAKRAGLPRFLAAITTATSVTIGPYHRLVTGLPDGWMRRLRGSGAHLTPVPAPTATGGPVQMQPARPGIIHLCTERGLWSVSWPEHPGPSLVDQLDHSIVERRLIRGGLQLGPGDPRVVYLGGPQAAEFARRRVNSGHAQLAVMLAPVGMRQFLQVNLARQQMPRKSTWFGPKPLTGLVLARTSPDLHQRTTPRPGVAQGPEAGGVR